METTFSSSFLSFFPSHLVIVHLVWSFNLFNLHASSLLSHSCSSMAVSKLEPELRDSIVSQYGDAVQRVYFNKGLWGLIGIICSTHRSQYSLIIPDFWSIVSLFKDLFLWFHLFLFFLELNDVFLFLKKKNQMSHLRNGAFLWQIKMNVGLSFMAGKHAEPPSNRCLLQATTLQWFIMNPEKKVQFVDVVK